MDALSAVARGKLEGLELDIADVAAKRRLSKAAQIREAKKRLERNKIEKRAKRKTRQELRRSFRRGIKMQKMLGMMKVKVEDLGNTLNPSAVEVKKSKDELETTVEETKLDSNTNGDEQAASRASRAIAFEKKRRAALKEATKRRVKKLQTASLLSGIYFKSKSEQMNILFEAIIETALVFHVEARAAASPRQMAPAKTKGFSHEGAEVNGSIGASIDLSKSKSATQTPTGTNNHPNNKSAHLNTEKKKESHHVMPAKFLEFLSLYIGLLTREQDRVLERKHRFEVGVQKLGMASAEVTEMNTQIDRMTPMLEEAQVHTARVMKRLDDARPGVEKKRAVVRLDEKRATKEAEKVARTKLECEEDLKVALPMLSEAMKALDTISSKDISNLKSMANPPEGVKLVLEAVCIMLKVDPKKKTNRGNGEVSYDYWKPAKKLMGDTHFLDKLREYDKDNIPPRIVRQVRQTYVPMDEFAPENVKRASSAAEGMCKWILAILEYDRVLNFIRPKRIALEDSEKALKKTLMDLGSKRRALRDVEAELAQLQQEYDKAVERADRLINTLKLCELKVQRARDLLKGLGGEADKWTENAHELSKRSVMLVGDMLLSAAVVTYTGILSEDHRNVIVKSWINACISRGIDLTKQWSLRKVLGHAERDREWIARGLPDDDYHVENAIMVAEAQRFPLLIDPQGQARRWLKSAFRNAGIMTTMLSDASFEATISAGIVQGHPVLLENMDEAIESAASGTQMSKTLENEDEKAIETLKNAQEERDEVIKGQTNLKTEMIQLDKQREPYRSLAAAISPHFFLLQDMSRIRSIYQYSLPLFMDWFGEAIKESESSDKIGRRIRMVIKQWNQVLVENATASVFERDEIVFLLRVAIVAAAKKHTEEQNTTVKKKKSKKGGSLNQIDNKEATTKMTSHSEGKNIRMTSLLFERRLTIEPNSSKARYDLPEVAAVFEDIFEAGELKDEKKELKQVDQILETMDSQADAARAVLQRSEDKDSFYRIRVNIHKNFRLWCVARPVEHYFPVSMLQESICVIIEAVTGLRSNVLQSLSTAPMGQRAFWDVELEDGGRNGDGTGLELGLGIRQLEMAHTDSSLQDHAESEKSLYTMASKKLKVLLSGYLITELHYGGHVGDPEDRAILRALYQMSKNAAISLGSKEMGYRSLDQHRMFVRSLHAEPVLPGLAPGAALSRQVVESSYLIGRFTSAAHLGRAITTNTSTGGGGGGGSTGRRSRGPSLAFVETTREETQDMAVAARKDNSHADSDTELSSEGNSFDPYEHFEEHTVEWTKQWDHVRKQIVRVIGKADLAAYVDGAHLAGQDERKTGVTVVSTGHPFGILEGERLFPEARDGCYSQYQRIIKRERISLEALRVEIATTVGVWTEIMEGRVDNRRMASMLETAVGGLQTPHDWTMWGGDWSLCSEMSEFLALLKERQQYWRTRWVNSSRRIWWGAFSRPAAVLGAVIVDSGHGWELGGLGDVIGKVWHSYKGSGDSYKEVGYESDEIEESGEHRKLGDLAAENERAHGLEQGAVIIEGLWLLGCQWTENGHIIDDADGSGGDGRVAAPDVLLRRRHESDVRFESRIDHVSVPLYAHRGSSVLCTVPLPLADEDVGLLSNEFFSLRGVKILVL
eukprot:g3354.t1